MNYYIRRIIVALLTVLVSSSLVFFAIRILPGDPVLMRLGESAATPEVVAQMAARLGMDVPVPVQYLHWLGGLVQFDFGNSIATGRPVAEELVKRLPRSLELMAGGILVSLCIGIPLGVVAARRPDSLIGHTASVVALVGLSAPTFVKGLILIILFSITLGWLPSSGYTPFLQDPAANLRAMILPSLTLGLGFAGVVQRVTRASLAETLNRDYVRTVRAKGVSERRAVYRHALPNAMIPVISVVGMRIGSMLGGMVVIESLFNWPGLSSYLIEACYARDYPAIQASLFIIFLVFSFISLTMDVLMGVINPRRRDV
ncbi:ABC transporter permease [Chelatococcus asaccharovorans]|uniref:Peptide/nickel transport system permease protein n=1 Tax=Chelatococcus asaccharovorans TaxID=28210 RepID=A0A2V3U096_9HYPH|nr:ABC transporter permease [Chelatococcus asaccharovorans]MBS7707749.1 ABC transporter permease [Chelatococcus asaccharovorans]PXW55326.1 peptide/nickel transport system permease protein [Chelatococcus asaccharovorans]